MLELRPPDARITRREHVVARDANAAGLGVFAQIVIFVLMAVVVLVRPAGLFGREEVA